MRLTVFCHVHYLDVWEEISASLASVIERPFRLVITTSLSASAITRPKTRSLLEMRVVQTENRGRDIRPFLQALRDEPEFDIGLKLHTKRSEHRLDGEGWRHAIIGSLLPNAAAVEAVSERVRSEEPIGFVAPTGTLCSIAPWIGRNRHSIAQVSQRLGTSPSRLFNHCPYFIAGSMFWFRSDAVRRLAAAEIDDLFAPERGQTDGTAAHAIERLFVPVAESDGWLTISMSSFIGSRSMDFNELREIALAEIDSDPRFLRRPHPYIAWLSNHFPIIVTFYRSMPTPVRMSIRNILRKAAQLLPVRSSAQRND